MSIDQLIELSLQEDIGSGDITSEFLHLDNVKSTAFIVAKENGVLAGLNVAIKVFRYLDSNISYVIYKKDGDYINKGEDIIKISGVTKAILSGERVALNFLQHLSGVAAITRKMVDMVSPYGVKLLDTRKTTPLLRELEKYAVRLGGGYNHRFGLYDFVMLKENHIQAAGSINKAVSMVRKSNINYKVEVEVKNLKEFREAVKVKVDRIMLDNMTPGNIAKAVKLACGEVELEVSGGVTIDNIAKFAETGVDFISTGAITHSVKALDLSLLFRE
jgi:nicotinate-nucleotide pyrophosphorylase (carboxylating)